MNISSGLSHISVLSAESGKVNKISIWPEYNNGKIHRIPPVQERTEPEFSYIKRSSFNPETDSRSSYLNDIEYTFSGNVNAKSSYTPGSIFEAIA